MLFTANTYADNENQLKQVQSQLGASTKQLKDHQKQVNALQKLLREHELKLADGHQELQVIQQKIDQQRAKQSTLQAQRMQLQETLEQQQQTLAAQLQSAYQQGYGDYLKMMLNQEDASQFERMFSYYGYLNKARIHAVEGVQQSQAKLDENNRQLLAQQQQLEQSLTTQKRQQQEQEQHQAKRQKQLDHLNALLRSDQQQIAQLQQAKSQLKALIDKEIAERQRQAERKQAQVMDGLGRLKGKLPWPLKGRVLHQYGSIIRGQSRWQGIVIDSHPGTPIKAIASGRVVYADWLRGYGLVLVLDHGQDYLSFYGYAQSLNRELGEEVRANDVIAYAGNTGGQETNSLFFQIRHQGQAQDPRSWLQR